LSYKVCILAAGVGSRVASSNLIHKALLPLNEEATISKIIQKFPKTIKFVVAVGYNKNQLKDYLLFAHPDRKFTFVEIDKFSGPGSGPGYSLLKCKNKLLSPFIFTTVDTIVLENIPKKLNKDWVGVAPVKNTLNYCTFKVSNNLVTSIEDKTVNNNKLAFIGIAGIKNYKLFFKSLEENNIFSSGEIQVSSGLKGLLATNLNIEFFTWYDTGNDENYKITKEVFEEKSYDFSKPNEILYLINKKIIKFNTELLRVKNLSKRALFLKKVIPKNFHSTDNFISYDFYPGKVYYDCISDKLNFDLFNFLNKNLWDKKKKIPDNIFSKLCLKFYKEKTLERISIFRKKYKIIDDDYYINGINVNKLSFYLDKIDWDILSKGVQSNIHGDLQFDNIIYNHAKNEFKLIDWRSDFSGNTEVGDLYYDLAKLYSGCILQYNEIKKNKFNFEMIDKNVSFDFSINYSLTRTHTFLIKFLIENKYDINKIKILSSLIFLNMAPLHSQPFSHLLYFLGLYQLKHIFN